MILQTAMLNTKVSLLDNGKNGMVTYFLSSCKESCTTSIGGSVVECSPATRAARVRFPADANSILQFFFIFYKVDQINGASLQFLPRDVMHKRGLCCHAVSVRLSVRHV